MDTEVFEYSDFSDGSEVATQGEPQDVGVQLGVGDLNRESGSPSEQTNVVQIKSKLNDGTQIPLAEVQAATRQRLRDLREKRAATQG